MLSVLLAFRLVHYVKTEGPYGPDTQTPYPGNLLASWSHTPCKAPNPQAMGLQLDGIGLEFEIEVSQALGCEMEISNYCKRRV